MRTTTWCPSKAWNCPCCVCLHLPVTGADTSHLKRLKTVSGSCLSLAVGVSAPITFSALFVLVGVNKGQTSTHSCLLAGIVLDDYTVSILFYSDWKDLEILVCCSLFLNDLFFSVWCDYPHYNGCLKLAISWPAKCKYNLSSVCFY